MTIVFAQISRLFLNFKKKKVRVKLSFSDFFCQTGKKAASAFSEEGTESSSLGRIGADFAWKKVILYEIDDEEVI